MIRGIPGIPGLVSATWQVPVQDRHPAGKPDQEYQEYQDYRKLTFLFFVVFPVSHRDQEYQENYEFSMFSARCLSMRPKTLVFSYMVSIQSSRLKFGQIRAKVLCNMPEVDLTCYCYPLSFFLKQSLAVRVLTHG